MSGILFFIFASCHPLIAWFYCFLFTVFNKIYTIKIFRVSRVMPIQHLDIFGLITCSDVYDAPRWCSSSWRCAWFFCNVQKLIVTICFFITLVDWVYSCIGYQLSLMVQPLWGGHAPWGHGATQANCGEEREGFYCEITSNFTQFFEN